MDAIQQCLTLVPIPYLAPAFAIFNYIWTCIQQVQGNREQLRVLTRCISELLCVLDTEYRAGRLREDQNVSALENLCKLLEEISTFVQKQATYGFIKMLYKKDELVSKIDGCYKRINSSVASFQIAAIVATQYWQRDNDHARLADQELLHDRLNSIEANQGKLQETLNVQQNNIVAMMAFLQRQLDENLGGVRERQFYSRTLSYLSTQSGHQIQLEHWMVTSFDVEFGPEIGTGGFGQVFKGTWNMTDIALKVLKTEGGPVPNSTILRREVKIWSKLRHPHILQFLGANILDDKPFIVMPFLKHGNARNYIEVNDNCDRQTILHHMCLGMIYLHSRNIVHGDLKALNVLIDDSEKAVLCDFGLSDIIADVTSRTTNAKKTSTFGSRNWMAPETFKGGSLKKTSDIYALGMVIYEIHTNKTPLRHVSPFDFVELVVHRNVRPGRPDEDEAPQLTDEMWSLAERCWATEPSDRPNIKVVCDAISNAPRYPNPAHPSVPMQDSVAPAATSPYTVPLQHSATSGQFNELRDVKLTVPLLRAWKERTSNHFYTTDIDEMQKVEDEEGYNGERTPGYIFINQQPSTVPLYRLYNANSCNHFYTIDAKERDNAIANLGYKFQSIPGYVYSDGSCGGIPLYRSFHGGITDHFYTSSSVERDRAVAGGWGYERIECYILPC